MFLFLNIILVVNTNQYEPRLTRVRGRKINCFGDRERCVENGYAFAVFKTSRGPKL